jgi:hypothetical protein
MSWQSRVPAVIDALVALWDGTVAATVHDGPIPVESADLAVLSVGHDGGDDGIATEGRLRPDGMSLETGHDTFSVACKAAVLVGSGDAKVARTKVFELFDAAANTLAADHTLGGLVLSALVDQYEFAQRRFPERGVVAEIVFTVACDGFTRV